MLEEKVESAVKRIEQLNAENAALRRKCAELSNALNAKSEQFSSFQNDQSRIEEGILKALNRLNAVENVVLSAAGSMAQKPETSPVTTLPPQEKAEAIPEVKENLQTQGTVNTLPQFSEPALSEEVKEAEKQEELPAEIEIPSVKTQTPENPQQNQIPDQQVQDSSTSADKAASDVAFEFVDNSQAEKGEQGSQPMFDIF